MRLLPQLVLAASACVWLPSCSADTREVELSYSEVLEGCEGCAGFKLRFARYWNVPALLQAGADVRAVSDDGRTALDFVAPKTESVVGSEFAYNRKNCQLTLETLRAAALNDSNDPNDSNDSNDSND